MTRNIAGIVLATALVGITSTGIAALQRPAATSQDELEQGRRLMRRGEPFEALKHLRRANELAGNSCGECLLDMAEAMVGMKAYPNALETASQAIAALSAQPTLLARAHGLRGEVFQLQAETDPSKYPDAEKEFRLGVSFDPENDTLYFGLGLTLLKLNRDDEGIAALKRYLEMSEIGPAADAARAMIANPRRGRERLTPDYTIVMADGARLTPEALRGKVVLYDFWATGCAPCVAAVPSMRNLQKKYAAAPFAIVSISADTDDYAWRRFTLKEQMVWPQYWDKGRSLAAKFNVTEYPTYVLVDAEGIEQLRVVGEGLHQSRTLSKAIDAKLAVARR
jgi:thiol-disulfide isomerase/thioredoxin